MSGRLQLLIIFNRHMDSIDNRDLQMVASAKDLYFKINIKFEWGI